MKKSLIFGLIFILASAGFSFANEFNLTTKPVVLPAGTDGSVGTSGTYVLFGDWPQTVKSDNVSVYSTQEVINGWECNKGSDGFYYVKLKANTRGSEIYKFNNGKDIIDEKDYYFKLEPIKWRVLTDNYQGGKLLLAENILINSLFDDHVESYGFSTIFIRKLKKENIYPNNYKYSTIRAYLNGLNGRYYDVEDFTGNGFINKAFTKEAIESINKVTVDNSVKSTGFRKNEYACESTEDKIFLLSECEVTDRSYGFASDGYECDVAKRKSVTDYAIAMATEVVLGGRYGNHSRWWLRSPYYNCNIGVCYVSHGGSSSSACHFVYDNYSGVVPALSISF